MQAPPRPYVMFANASTEDVCGHAARSQWTARASQHPDELTWHVDGNSTIVWHALDEGFGAFLVTGAAWQVALVELGEVFRLLGDVEVMSLVGQASTQAELMLWGARLCEFARGQEFYEHTLHVIVSLVGSEHFDFAAVAVRALSRARWPQLVEPLEKAALRWPALNQACQRALASIEGGEPDRDLRYER